MATMADLDYSIFPKGTIIFEQGDAPDFAYLIKSGEVEIITSAGGDDERIIDVLSVGDFFGEMALVDKVPRSATAVARKDLICAVLSQEHFEAKLASADFFTEGLIRLLSKRLRKMTQGDP